MFKKLLLLVLPLTLLCACSFSSNDAAQSGAGEPVSKEAPFNAGQYDKIKLTYLPMAGKHAAGWTPLRAQKAFGADRKRERIEIDGRRCEKMTYQKGPATITITYAGVNDQANAFQKHAEKLQPDSTVHTLSRHQTQMIRRGQSLTQVLQRVGYPPNRSEDRTAAGRRVVILTYAAANKHLLIVELVNDTVKQVMYD